MKPSFSEFQFAYGVTRELEGGPGWGVIDTPRIPTQKQEADFPADMVTRIKSGGVKLAPLFVQYKRSDWMKRSNASSWDQLKRLGYDLSDGYYRFQVYHEESKQHNKLVELASMQPFTFYVAPMFHEMDEYLSYVDGSLIQNTTFIQCGKLDKISTEDHRVTYTSQDSSGHMLSEPTRFSLRSAEELFNSDTLPQNASTFQRLRGEFDDIRELAATSENMFPSNYDAEDPFNWFAQQRQFLTTTLNTDVLFFAETGNL